MKEGFTLILEDFGGRRWRGRVACFLRRDLDSKSDGMDGKGHEIFGKCCMLGWDERRAEDDGASRVG